MHFSPLPEGENKKYIGVSLMKIDFISNGELGNLIVTVLNPDDIFEVVKTLEFLEKFLCVNLSYDVDFNYNEVHVRRFESCTQFGIQIRSCKRLIDA
jgi:hypothetical protein